MGIGYAYLTANLKITGTTKIGSARFDVHFENAAFEGATSNVTYPSNSNSNLAQGIPIIKGENNTELEWNVVFNQPGDYYEFSVDLINDGDYSGIEPNRNRFSKVLVDGIDEITFTWEDELITNIFDYEVSSSLYDEDTTLYDERYDFLYSKKHTTNTITVRVGLKNNLTTEQYAAILGKNIKFSYFLEYAKYEPGISSEHVN